MQDIKYIVYCHKNKINDKCYIGITSQLPKARWKNGRGYKRSKYFNSAIEKYGWDNFEHYILYYNVSYKEACNLEQQLIKYLKTQDKRYGYNLSKGGELTTTGIKWAEEKRKHFHNLYKGKHFSVATEYKKGCRQPHKEKPVRCIDTGIVYYCVAEARRQTGCGKHIYDVCNGKRNKCGGFRWEWA